MNWDVFWLVVNSICFLVGVVGVYYAAKTRHRFGTVYWSFVTALNLVAIVLGIRSIQ